MRRGWATVCTRRRGANRRRVSRRECAARGPGCRAGGAARPRWHERGVGRGRARRRSPGRRQGRARRARRARGRVAGGRRLGPGGERARGGGRGLRRSCPTGGWRVVMPHLLGGSLDALVRARGHLPPGEVVTVLAPVASALGRLHDLGVVHGDVSPGNVLLDLDGRPVLGDLGLGHVVGDVSPGVWGTDGYVAPEVLLGERPLAGIRRLRPGGPRLALPHGHVPGPPGLRPELTRPVPGGRGVRARRPGRRRRAVAPSRATVPVRTSSPGPSSARPPRCRSTSSATTTRSAR